MEKLVQGILIKEGQMLLLEGINDHGRIEHFFISGNVKENESEINAIKRELKEQLGLDHEVTFEISKEIRKEIKTYLIDLQKQEIKLDYGLENIKCIKTSYRATELKWVNIKDRILLNEFLIQSIKALFEEAIKRDYHEPWVDEIKGCYFSSHLGRADLSYLLRRKEREKIDAQAGKNVKITALIIALGLGILFNYFFNGDHIGISGFIYSIGIILAATKVIGKNADYSKKSGLIFLIPIILLSLSFSIYNDYLLRALNVILIPFLMASYLITLRYGKEIDFSLITNVLERVFSKAISVSPKFIHFGKELTSERRKLKENPIQRSILLGLVISVPLLIVIVTLLASADMMFKRYVENLGSLFDGFNIISGISQLFLIAVVAIYLFGFLWSFKYNEIQGDSTRLSKFKASWEPLTIITIISVINIAYLLFTIIQFSYLYGGGALPEGFSYAEYARKGFFELTLVTFINFIILLLSINLTKRDHKKLTHIANLSYSLLIVFTFNMLVSASYKMYLYETAFGFSRLRIFVQAFMVLIGILLVIVLLGIWIQRIPIFKYSVVAILVVYVALNYINVDRLIAKENIYRYEATQNIDVYYLTTLSYDAAPELIKLLEIEDAGIRTQIQSHLENQKQILNNHYNRWYEFNYFKNKFLKLVN